MDSLDGKTTQQWGRISELTFHLLANTWTSDILDSTSKPFDFCNHFERVLAEIWNKEPLPERGDKIWLVGISINRSVASNWLTRPYAPTPSQPQCNGEGLGPWGRGDLQKNISNQLCATAYIWFPFVFCGSEGLLVLESVIHASVIEIVSLFILSFYVDFSSNWFFDFPYASAFNFPMCFR